MEKGEYVGAAFEFAAEIVELEARSCGEDPLHHFRVRSGGEVRAAERGLRGDPFGGGDGFEPGGVGFQSKKEILKPAVLVAVLKCAGPDPKFFHVVAERGDSAGTKFGGAAKEANVVFDSAKRDQVAEFLEAREDPDGFAAIFRDVGAVKLVGLKAGSEKRKIVDEGIADVGFRKRGRELWLPDALGEPGAVRTLAEVLFEIVSEAVDLVDAIRFGDGDEDGLVESAADEFDLAGSDEIAEADEIVGMMLLDPEEEGAGIVNGEAEGGMAFNEAQKTIVGIAKALFEDGVKISGGLMGVDDEGEVELEVWLGRRTHRP